MLHNFFTLSDISLCSHSAPISDSQNLGIAETKSVKEFVPDSFPPTLKNGKTMKNERGGVKAVWLRKTSLEGAVI